MQMNTRYKYEKRTGFGNNPYTEDLNIKPYTFIDSFNTNANVVKANKRLADIHRKRKNETQNEENENMKKIAKKTATAA
jgi:hypothetical protein